MKFLLRHLKKINHEMLTKLKLHTLKTKFRKWKFTEHNRHILYTISNGVMLNLNPDFKQSIEAFGNLYYILMHINFNQSNLAIS